MAFVVEDGTGLATATSYVSVADAQSYIDDFVTGVTITEQSLTNATRQADLEFGHRYRGELYNDTQSLLFPRSEFIDGKGRTIAEASVPTALEQYVALRASDIVQGNNTEVYQSDPGVTSITQSIDGAVSQSKTYAGVSNVSKQDQYVGVISPLLMSDSGDLPFTTFQKVL